MAQNNHHTAISDAELGKQLLKKQLADLNKNPVEGFSAGLISDSDFFKWEVRTCALRITLICVHLNDPFSVGAN